MLDSDTAPEAVIVLDARGVITGYNPQAEKTFGWPGAEAIGKSIAEFISFSEATESLNVTLEQWLASAAGPTFPGRLVRSARHQSGRTFPVELSLSPLRDERGEEFTAFVRDLSDRQEAVAARAHLAAIIDSANDAILSKNLDGIITSWNAAAQRLFGYSAEEIIGRSILLLIPADRLHEETRIIQQLRRGEVENLETVRQHKNGQLLDVSVTVSPIRDPLGKIVGASKIVRDIRERKHLEERFRATVESAPLAMVMIQQDGRIILVNAQTEALFGYGREELLGRPVEVLVPARFREQHPDWRRGFFADPEARQMGVGRDLHGLRKDGSEFPVEIGLNPVTTEEGLFVLSAIVDITERKQGEERLRQYAAELERSNQELDQFAYSASHDLRAPLRAIKNLAQWISEDARDVLPQESQQHLELMHQRIDRMERLLTDLLTYSRVGREKHQAETIDTTRLVHEVVEFLAPPPGFSIRVGSLPHVVGPRPPLEQVFRNLIGNAIKHHDRPDGRIEIDAVAEKGEGDFIEFLVRDDGPGIPEQYHEQIFQLFQTLKPRDQVEGSGMGLALVKKIVENQGGTIILKSAPGKGATFHFAWPRSPQA
jgi:PAS domain S-box-containing protein